MNHMRHSADNKLQLDLAPKTPYRKKLRQFLIINAAFQKFIQDL